MIVLKEPTNILTDKDRRYLFRCRECKAEFLAEKRDVGLKASNGYITYADCRCPCCSSRVEKQIVGGKVHIRELSIKDISFFFEPDCRPLLSVIDYDDTIRKYPVDIETAEEDKYKELSELSVKYKNYYDNKEADE